MKRVSLATWHRPVKVSEKYVEPQVGLLIDHYTKRNDYIFFSTYTTEFDIGEEHYKYVCVGFSKIFIPIEMPKKRRICKMMQIRLFNFIE